MNRYNYSFVTIGEIVHVSGADLEFFHSGVEEIKGGGGKNVGNFFMFIQVIDIYKYQYKTNK